MSGWEVTVRPQQGRNGPIPGEHTVRAINRRRGWVQTIEHLSAADVERFDPDAAWARGLERAS